MARITVEDCIDKFSSRFELVLVAAHRARNLYSGDEPKVDKNNDKNPVIALREIAEESFPIEEMKENLIQEYQTITISDEEEENLEIESKDSIMAESKEDSEMAESKEDSEMAESKEDSENIFTDAVKQVEEEIKELTSSEDANLKDHYEIKDSLQSLEDDSSSEFDEQETTS